MAGLLYKITVISFIYDTKNGRIGMMNFVLKSCRHSNGLRFIFVLILTAFMAVGCGGSDDDSDAVTTYYRDSDGDGYGDPNVSVEDYSEPEDYVPDNTDCDDTNKNIHGCCSPGVRFTDMKDGTVRDNNTGLIWLKDANALGEMNWFDAMNAAADLSSGEKGLADGSLDGDWRLPNKEEWEAFMCRDFYNPELFEFNKPALVNTKGDAQWSNGDAFTGVRTIYYWSSNEHKSNYAWHAYTGDGYTYTSYKEYSRGYYVWPVRNGN